MPKTRQLLRKEITYSAAKTDEFNILHRLELPAQQSRFFAELDGKREWMKTVVCHHLGLGSPDRCLVAEMDLWLHGSFNVCVPMAIDHLNGQCVLMRFPLPYRAGEDFRPGNCDEKIQCEAGAYAWLEQHCPDVPIPKLYGFALSTGEMFTRLDHLPFFSRCFQVLRRQFLSWLGKPMSSDYVRHQNTDPTFADTKFNGYLLIETIRWTRGTMLSNTWEEGRHDPKLRMNLFRDLSRIYLSITRVPLPRIGSFIIDRAGFLRLANRPLAVEMGQLESERIPTDIPRDYTYTTLDSYVVDVLGYHDNRFRFQPNAVNNLSDCGYQLSVLTGLRTVHQSLFNRAFRRGPFVFNFTDLHQSNIFVDEDWHITCLVDLEWTCVQPIEMFMTPYWLTGKSVDGLIAEEYDEVRRELMEALVKEEQDSGSALLIDNEESPQLRLSDIMEKSWESGAFWYSLALSSPSGAFSIFDKHIKPLFIKGLDDDFEAVMLCFFEKNVRSIAHRRVADRKEYDEQLRQAFEDN